MTRSRGLRLERQSALLAKETERADYAWRNTRTIEAARQTEMQARTGLEARCRRLEALLRDFLALDDWRDDAIAPAELIERARAEVGDNNQIQGPPIAAVPCNAGLAGRKDE